MANGMYSTPLMGTGIVANPMRLQRNATLMGTTMPTTPQVSTPMPPPPMSTVTQTPQVSTPMPPMSTVTQTPQVSTVITPIMVSSAQRVLPDMAADMNISSFLLQKTIGSVFYNTSLLNSYFFDMLPAILESVANENIDTPVYTYDNTQQLSVLMANDMYPVVNNNLYFDYTDYTQKPEILSNVFASVIIEKGENMRSAPITTPVSLVNTFYAYELTKTTFSERIGVSNIAYALKNMPVNNFYSR